VKNKLAIGIIILALAVFFVRQQLAYPAAWDQVHVGMSRQEVYNLIGPGGGEFQGWKGPFWRDSGIFIWHELELSMAGDQVIAIRINRYWGEHHPLTNVRSESAILKSR
jgi:hypothetical protein